MRNLYEEVKAIKNPYKKGDPYGLLRVSTQKSKVNKIGFSWAYMYFDIIEDKIKTLHNIDLRVLRQMVEEKNLEWCVTNVRQAQRSYDINRDVMDYYEKYLKGKGRHIDVIGE